MKKKFALLILSAALVLSACGADTTTTTQSIEPSSTASVEQSSVAESQSQKATTEEKTPEEDLSKEVEVILYAYSFDNSGIDAYIAKLKESNPDKNYSVYNDEYYSTTITERERLEFLEGLTDKTVVEEALSTLKTDETYGGAILDIKYNDSFENFEVYVDKSKYESNKLVCAFGSALVLQALSDTYQAYNFIMPEDRNTEIKIIDNATGVEITE